MESKGLFYSLKYFVGRLFGDTEENLKKSSNLSAVSSGIRTKKLSDISKELLLELL
jgi:hypothetical protein